MMVLLKEVIEKNNMKKTKPQEKYPELKCKALIQDGLCNLPNRNSLGQFREIPWNHTTDVHRGSILLNAGDNVTLTLYNVTLTSQKQC